MMRSTNYDFWKIWELMKLIWNEDQVVLNDFREHPMQNWNDLSYSMSLWAWTQKVDGSLAARHLQESYALKGQWRARIGNLALNGNFESDGVISKGSDSSSKFQFHLFRF